MAVRLPDVTLNTKRAPGILNAHKPVYPEARLGYRASRNCIGFVSGVCRCFELFFICFRLLMTPYNS